MQPLEDLFRISKSTISRYAKDTNNTALKTKGRPSLVPESVKVTFIANSNIQASNGDAVTSVNLRDRLTIAAKAVKENGDNRESFDLNAIRQMSDRTLSRMQQDYLPRKVKKPFHEI